MWWNTKQDNISNCSVRPGFININGQPYSNKWGGRIRNTWVPIKFPIVFLGLRWYGHHPPHTLPYINEGLQCLILDLTYKYINVKCKFYFQLMKTILIKNMQLHSFVKVVNCHCSMPKFPLHLLQDDSEHLAVWLLSVVFLLNVVKITIQIISVRNLSPTVKSLINLSLELP